MKTIWKYPLEVEDLNFINMPEGAEVGKNISIVGACRCARYNVVHGPEWYAS